MAKHGIGEGAFVYISDSAMATPANLEAISGNLFITRLPATYVETGRVVEEAVAGGAWTEVESDVPSSGRRKAASGCFVLLTNVPASGEMAHTGAEVLAAYKEQHGIEHNFGFLKDPLIVNDLFLKRPDRIEVLGFVLLVSLLAWSLMEHVMRSYLARTDSDIIGWDKKMTRKPTTFMMTTKFKGLLVARIGEEWFLTAPFTKAQQQFVQALGLSEEMILRKTSAGNPPDQKLPWNRL